MSKPTFVVVDPEGIVHMAWRTFNLFNDETYGATPCGRSFDMDDGVWNHRTVDSKVTCVTCLAEPHVRP